MYRQCHIFLSDLYEERTFHNQLLYRYPQNVMFTLVYKTYIKSYSSAYNSSFDPQVPIDLDPRKIHISHYYMNTNESTYLINCSWWKTSDFFLVASKLVMFSISLFIYLVRNVYSKKINKYCQVYHL